MFDTTTLLDSPSLLVLSCPAVDDSVGISAYLAAGRCTEPEDARGSADVLAAMLDATADDFTVTCTSLDRLRRITDYTIDEFETARQIALAKTRSRSWIAEAVLRQWTYRDDPYFGIPFTQRTADLAALTPTAFARYLTEATSKRLVVAICSPSTVDYELNWPGTDRTRPEGPKPAAGGRSFGTDGTFIALSLPIVPRNDPSYRLAALLASALAANDGPLMRRLRHERGHLYRVEASAVPRPTSGDLVIKAAVAEGTAQSCLDEFRRISTVDPRFLEVLKERLILRIRHALSTNAGRAADVVSSHFFALPTDHHRTIEPGIRAVSADTLDEFVHALPDSSSIIL